MGCDLCLGPTVELLSGCELVTFFKCQDFSVRPSEECEGSLAFGSEMKGEGMSISNRSSALAGWLAVAMQSA
jgi:hypothetical protein